MDKYLADQCSKTVSISLELKMNGSFCVHLLMHTSRTKHQLNTHRHVNSASNISLSILLYFFMWFLLTSAVCLCAQYKRVCTNDPVLLIVYKYRKIVFFVVFYSLILFWINSDVREHWKKRIIQIYITYVVHTGELTKRNFFIYCVGCC